MQLLSYKDPTGQYRAGVKVGEAVFDAEALTGHQQCGDVLSMLQDWDATGTGVPVDGLVQLFEEVECFRAVKVEVVPAVAVGVTVSPFTTNS